MEAREISRPTRHSSSIKHSNDDQVDDSFMKKSIALAIGNKKGKEIREPKAVPKLKRAKVIRNLFTRPKDELLHFSRNNWKIFSKQSARLWFRNSKF